MLVPDSCIQKIRKLQYNMSIYSRYLHYIIYILKEKARSCSRKICSSFSLPNIPICANIQYKKHYFVLYRFFSNIRRVFAESGIGKFTYFSYVLHTIAKGNLFLENN